MRERPLVYLVPPMAAALYAAVCLELPVQLHICLLYTSTGPARSTFSTAKMTE